MLRILPFLIIILLVLAFSKLATVFDGAPDLFAVAELSAQAAPASAQTQAQTTSQAAQNPPTSQQVSSAPMSCIPQSLPQYSATEVQVLESLAKRRKQLDERANEISLKENVLKVAEQRVNQKISALQALMQEANKVLQQYNEKRSQEIQALVKIYENMKPKDAARIFDELTMPILVEVSSKMNEAKLASILALMSSNHAKDLTMELANRRKIDMCNFN